MITAITPGAVGCERECVVGGIRVIGSGFYNGGQITLSQPAKSFGGQVLSTTEIFLTLAFDADVFQPEISYSPGWFDVTVSSPPGPGGGTSNIGRIAFVGSLNTLACLAADCFFLDQGIGKVHAYSIVSGTKTSEWNTGRLSYGITTDDGTGHVGTTHSNRAIGFTNTLGQGGAGASNGLLPFALVAKTGWACVSQDLDNQIGVMQLNQTNIPINAVPVGQAPHAVAMISIGADLACVVYNREDRMLSAVRVSDLQILRFLSLSGITPLSQMAAATRGGWHIAAFGAGPAVGKVAVFAQEDKILVLVDLNSQPAIELRRIQLNGAPFRIAARESDGSVIVARADAIAGVTRFDKVDVATGVVTPLQATTNFLGTGLAVSSDGTKLLVANRRQFAILSAN